MLCNDESIEQGITMEKYYAITILRTITELDAGQMLFVIVTTEVYRKRKEQKD